MGKSTIIIDFLESPPHHLLNGPTLADSGALPLHPYPMAVRKHTQPVNDKVMANYSICGLILVPIREILVMSAPKDVPLNRRLMGTHSASIPTIHTV